ncbi:MAG: helix-turn-helix domain-containing protein [Fimbriiglobus sp.]
MVMNTKIFTDKTDSTSLTVRERLGLTQADFARLVGLSERSVASWEAGETLNANSSRRIAEATRLADEMEAIFRTPEPIGRWLTSPNDGFESLSPIDIVEKGQIDRLWRVLYFLRSGSPN